MTPSIPPERPLSTAASSTDAGTASQGPVLAGSDAVYRLLVDQVEDYAICLVDPDGRAQSWNVGAERMTGYTAAEILGREIATLYPPGEVAAGTPGAQLRDALRDGRAEYEGWCVGKDGRRLWATLVLCALRDDTGALLGFALIARDLTERRAMRDMLEEAKEAAEAASRAKSDFLATTSHELRTPINALIGYAELLELGIPDPPTDGQRAHLERLRRSARHLLGVVSQVLDLSRIEAGKVDVRVRAACAGDAAEAAIALVEPQALERSIALACACRAETDVAYLGDPDRVEQILVNLLGNAVKFTEPGGRVTLTCGAAREPAPDVVGTREGGPGGWCFFRVEDTGPGIPAERAETVFEPFVQLDQAYTRRHGGAGLGLAITRRLARLMGGDVTLRSAPGEGAIFLVWLPAARPEDVARRRTAGERRGRGRYARGLARVADVALDVIEPVLSGYVARLRTDPALPHARALTEAQLEDHTATLLADMAQCLAAIEVARGAPSAELRDGSAIQRIIARRHGVQRARLGWTEAEVRREFAILGEEFVRALRARLHGTPDVELEPALQLVGGFIAHAEAVCLRALVTPAGLPSA